MRTIQVTDEEFIAAMDTAVAKMGGDYTYKPTQKEINSGDVDGCFYFHPNGKPRCIVGHALSILGVKKDDMYGEDWANKELPGFLTLSPIVVHAAYKAQLKQDIKEPWSVALEAFHTTIENGEWA